MPRSSNAAGSMAGYLYQLDRAVLHLATAPSCQRVGIETLDDVVVESVNGLTIEQLKHSVKNRGSTFSGKSSNLWRSLEIWCDAIDAKTVDPAMSRFFLITTLSVPSACLVREIHSAKSNIELDACILKMRALAASLNRKLKVTADRVMGHSQDFLRELLRNIELVDAATAGVSAMRQNIIAGLHIPSDMPGDILVDALHGWVKDRAMESWRSGKPASITRDSFDRQVDRIRQSIKQRKFRESALRLIQITPEQIAAKKTNRFVKQIELVFELLVEEAVTEAIKDYLRAKFERTRLSAEGDITKSDLDDFDDSLEDRWKRLRLRTLSSAQEMDAVEKRRLGKALYHETTEFCGILAGTQTVYLYLTAGSYHDLADVKRVGWHPDFDTELP